MHSGQRNPGLWLSWELGLAVIETANPRDNVFINDSWSDTAYGLLAVRILNTEGSLGSPGGYRLSQSQKLSC